MRRTLVLIAGSGLIAGLSGGATPAAANCNVFDRHPCNSSFCSVFRRGCIPDYDIPLGQDLRLAIESTNTQTAAADGGPPAKDDPAEKLNSIRDLFAALRACWVPPPLDEAREGMQMSVRLSFNRAGNMIGTPRVTYTTPDAPLDLRNTYHDAIDAALGRCTPLPFTAGMGGAVAGRPINIRFVDNRKLQ
jgi:hypothetical protein